MYVWFFVQVVVESWEESRFQAPPSFYAGSRIVAVVSDSAEKNDVCTSCLTE